MITEERLDNYLCEPSEKLIEDLTNLKGDFMILGAGGKVGPTISVMLKRACERAGRGAKVYAVGRFRDPHVVKLLEKENVTMLAAELTDPEQVAALPKAENVIYLVGRKFGTTGNAHETWFTNVVLPARLTAQLGAVRYVVFSTGNVYPFCRPETGGCTEEVVPDPVGEYGMSCLGRERIFEYAAKHYGAKVLIFRLSYAVDLRYGVLYDLAKRIMDEEPVSLNVPSFNCISQRYVAETAIRALTLASEDVEYLNVTGPELFSTKEAALALAKELGKEVTFTGTPGEKALLSNADKCMKLFGRPDMGVRDMIPLQAQWILEGGRELGKPTHFEEREGKY